MATRSRRGFGYLRKLPSKRWQASYIGPDGVRHTASTTYSTKMEGEAWLNAERITIERSDPEQWRSPEQRALAARSKNRLTFEEYSASWMASSRVKPTTKTLYERLLRLRVTPGMGDRKLEDISQVVVATWWRSTQGQRADHQAYSLLRTILNAAISDGLIETNPCRIKGAGRPSRERSLDPITPEQVQQISAAMPPEWSIGVLLGAWCALRSGEVRELRRKDIDLDRKSIHIARAVSRAGTELIVDTPKTDAGIRTVPIPAALIPALVFHMDQYVDRSQEALLIGRIGYSAQSGQNVTDNLWGHAYRKAVAEALGQQARVTFHDLRHVGLTYAGIAGATVRELQTLAGHTTATMAMRYQEVANSHMADVMSKMSTLITGEPADTLTSD